MSNNKVVLFLRNVNGESRWFEVSDVKIWIRIFWKMFTNGKYVGEIENEEPNGQGTLTSAYGEKYVGEWKEGKLHGQGTYTWSDFGVKYDGGWKDGKKWNGTVYDNDGINISKYINGVKQ